MHLSIFSDFFVIPLYGTTAKVVRMDIKTIKGTEKVVIPLKSIEFHPDLIKIKIHLFMDYKSLINHRSQQEIDSTKGTIKEYLGWTEEKYCQLQFYQGCHFLEKIKFENAPVDLHKELRESKSFWECWKILWCYRDIHFSNFLKDKNPDRYRAIQVYVESNSPDFLLSSNNPVYCQMHDYINETVHLLIKEVVKKKEKCYADN